MNKNHHVCVEMVDGAVFFNYCLQRIRRFVRFKTRGYYTLRIISNQMDYFFEIVFFWSGSKNSKILKKKTEILENYKIPKN